MASSPLEGQRIVLRSHPHGALKADNFALESFPVPAIGEGEFLVRARFVSVDPMLRLFVAAKPLSGMMPTMPPGTTIPGATVGEIMASNNPDFAVGEMVESRFGWQSHAVTSGTGVNRVNAAIGAPENALGIGGLPGFTAFCGIAAAGGVKPGQTWLVSGAAGAVGSVLGPMIKARGGRVVGIAGGAAKQQYLQDTCGYAAVADRHSPDFLTQLGNAVPAGVDVYFDNVGAPLLPMILPLLGRGALVLICGLMGQYQDAAPSLGSDNLPALLQAVMFKGVRVQGFTQLGQDAMRPAFEQEIQQLLASGALQPDVHIVDGLENLPRAMVDLFEHSTTGKVVVRV